MILVQSHSLALGHLVLLLFSHLLGVTLQHQFGTPDRLRKLLKTHIYCPLVVNQHFVVIGALHLVVLSVALHLRQPRECHRDIPLLQVSLGGHSPLLVEKYLERKKPHMVNG